jgi:DNA-cytosine methyltransferase
MRYLSVCSGMEAASVAWHPLGWTPVGFSEIEPFPCAILKHRFPNVPNYGSLTEYQSWPIEQGAVDLLVGGTPCQSFSVAGKRAGLNDPRGQLMFSFLGLAEKLGKPRWIVWENVPGCLSSGEPKGSDFGCLLQGLVELGYGVSWRILDAQHFGVPQRRRRVFVVACLGDWRAAAEVLSLREGLRGYLETGNKKRKGVAADAPGGVGAGSTVGTICARDYKGADNIYVEEGKCIVEHGSTIGTLCARDYKGVGNQYVQEGKCIPCPAPQPFRKSKRACSTTDNETWVPADASNTLNNFDLGDTRTTHAVVQPIPIQDGREMEKKQNGLGIANQGDPAYTIDTTGAQAIAIQGTIIGRSDKAGPQGTGATEGGPMFTLTKTDIHGVCHQMPGSVAWTQNQREEVRLLGDKVGAIALPGTHQTNYIAEPKVYENHPNDSRVTGPLDVAPTVVSRFGTGGGNVPFVNNEPTAITFQPDNLRREAGADPSFTTTTTLKASAGDQTPHVAYAQGVDLYNQTLTGDLHVPLRTAGGHGAPACMTPMAVRRLTPVECERLQGFPDNWSRIPWKGKPEEECPDGPRYKACGNSMAVPCMFWIGSRIAAVDSTLSSHA